MTVPDVLAIATVRKTHFVADVSALRLTQPWHGAGLD
jgi:hypothetical protein